MEEELYLLMFCLLLKSSQACNNLNKVTTCVLAAAMLIFVVVAFFTVQSQCDMGFAFPSIPHIRHGTCSCTVLERKEKCTTLVAI